MIIFVKYMLENPMGRATRTKNYNVLIYGSR